MVISLYFHIPFCTKKCPYCHFYVIPNQARYYPLLMEGLRLEWDIVKNQIPPETKIASIYFGGGTPSLFPTPLLKEIIEWTKVFAWEDDCEITIEANPEEVNFDSYLETGINRVSIGVQSLDDRSLQSIERMHSANKAKEAIFAAKKAKIDNISIDLMYDLPDQTESSWRYTLDQISDLPIQHLSLYNLTIEPHTPFAKRKIIQPKPSQSLKFLNMALEHFEKIGLKRYEISAFAKNGKISKHNTGYWTYRPFFGLGPSAFSYYLGERFQNSARLHQYTDLLKNKKSPIVFREKLEYPNDVLEKLVVGLRMTQGVDLCKTLPEKTKLELHALEKEKLLILNNEKATLTDRGMLFYDEIASKLI